MKHNAAKLIYYSKWEKIFTVAICFSKRPYVINKKAKYIADMVHQGLIRFNREIIDVNFIMDRLKNAQSGTEPKTVGHDECISSIKNKFAQWKELFHVSILASLSHITPQLSLIYLNSNSTITYLLIKQKEYGVRALYDPVTITQTSKVIFLFRDFTHQNISNYLDLPQQCSSAAEPKIFIPNQMHYGFKAINQYTNFVILLHILLQNKVFSFTRN
jgi:hypothetical protein